MRTPSRVASVSAGLGAAAAACFAAGPAAIALGALSPFLGFRLFLFGALGGLIALLLGLVGLWRTRAASGRDGRGRALLGTLLGAGVLAIVLAGAGASLGLPPINDITTSPDDPPRFDAAARDPANRGRELAYAGGDLASAQRSAYPDLAPIRLPVPPDEAWRRAEGAARALGWEITQSDPEGGRLEAIDVSRVFRFVDDVVVRVRPAEGGSVVDVRSRSRDGRGDLGANAARIRAFAGTLVK